MPVSYPYDNAEEDIIPNISDTIGNTNPLKEFLQLLQENILPFLEYIPLAELRQIHFQHDDVPSFIIAVI